MGRKKNIKFEQDFEGVIFGIISQLKDYRLCWHINKQLDLDLRRLNDLEIINRRKNKTAIYSLYKYENEMDKWVVNLVSNKYQGENLIPEMKQADFFLVIRGEVNNDHRQMISSSLKNISDTQLVILIDYATLKSGEYLIFE